MTKFVREYFDYHGGYLSYYAPEYKAATGAAFVARFKYAATSSKPRWITFMCKNFTVEEWAAARAAGLAPLDIMETKGFVLTHILKWRAQGIDIAVRKPSSNVVSMLGWLEGNL